MITTIIEPYPEEDLKSIGKRCGALYICPKDAKGKRLGPMVAYAGKDALGKNLIGDIYFNFRRVEPHSMAVECFAEAILEKLTIENLLSTFDTICGIPEGGRTLGQALSRLSKKRFVYATKVPKAIEQGKKQEYSWDLSQFEFFTGERLLMIEDIINNLQNTDNTLAQVGSIGTQVVLLGAALNRSPFADKEYVPKSGPYAGEVLPIVCAIRDPYPEYEQGNPEVATDVAAGNVEFEVKKNWAKLMAAMDASSCRGAPDSD